MDTTRLDHYCADLGIGSINLIIINVEGHEPSILACASQLRKPRAIGGLFLEINASMLGLAGTSPGALLDLS